MNAKVINILLAEDNKANQFISKAMIESVGSSVVIAENGLEVLDKVKEQVFDLILMDCQMPEMDGFEATEKVRSMDNPALANIPIVALTADVQKETRENCLQKGMNDFVSKPFTLDDITTLIQKWVKKEDSP